jgi:hypothetical protein
MHLVFALPEIAETKIIAIESCPQAWVEGLRVIKHIPAGFWQEFPRWAIPSHTAAEFDSQVSS